MNVVIHELSSAARERGIAGWAVAGVAAVLLEALLRLGAHALALLSCELDPAQQLALVASLALFGYGEGYLVLHRRFARSVVERAFAAPVCRGWRAYAAPLHAMGLVGVPVRTAMRGWSGVGFVVVAILVVRAMPSPWREIVDAGVAVALLVGLTSLVARFAVRFRDPVDPKVR